MGFIRLLGASNLGESGLVGKRDAKMLYTLYGKR